MSKGITMTEQQRQQLIELLKALGINTGDNLTANPHVVLDNHSLRVETLYVYDVEDLDDEQHAALEALTGWRIKR